MKNGFCCSLKDPWIFLHALEICKSKEKSLSQFFRSFFANSYENCSKKVTGKKMVIFLLFANRIWVILAFCQHSVSACLKPVVIRYIVYVNIGLVAMVLIHWNCRSLNIYSSGTFCISDFFFDALLMHF